MRHHDHRSVSTTARAPSARRTLRHAHRVRALARHRHDARLQTRRIKPLDALVLSRAATGRESRAGDRSCNRLTIWIKSLSDETARVESSKQNSIHLAACVVWLSAVEQSVHLNS